MGSKQRNDLALEIRPKIVTSAFWSCFLSIFLIIYVIQYAQWLTITESRLTITKSWVSISKCLWVIFIDSFDLSCSGCHFILISLLNNCFFSFFFYGHECFTCTYVCEPCVCFVLGEVGKRYWIPWNWSYRWLWVNMQALRNQTWALSKGNQWL